MEVRCRKKGRVNNQRDIAKKENIRVEGVFGRWTLIGVCCMVVALCNYYHASYMQEKHVMFSHLSTMEREMSFRTEMGFYYSFYKQVIETPSIKASLHLLTHDNLTEYPHTINALHRFNVYPEFIVGMAYRAFIHVTESYGVETRTCYSVNRHNLPSVQSCEGLGEPAIFYVHIIMILNGLMLSFLFLIAYHVSGGSIIGGFVSCILYFFNHRECTRVQWTPPLRESFSYPFILIQQYFLLQLLIQPFLSKTYSVYKFGFLVTTLSALLSWQFAQFSLLTQCIAVFMAYVVAGDTGKKVASQKILILLMVADLINVVLQFGNTLLLVGPLRPCIIMALLIISFEPLSLRLRFQNSPWAPLRWIALTTTLLLSTIFLKHIFNLVLQIKSDDHMFEILKSKFTDFRSFDSLLYTCAPEFDFYDTSSLLELTFTGLLPISASVVLIIILYTIYKLLQLFWNVFQNSKTEDANFLTSSSFCTIDTFYLLFQTIAYTLMAALIMRLKLFFTPQLCIIAAYMCNKRWPLVSFSEYVSRKVPLLERGAKKFGGHSMWLVILVLALCSVKGISNIKAEWNIIGSYSNWEQEQLLGIIMDRSKPEDSFVGQMATMATVRLVTGRPITMHPHYEDEDLRKRVHMSYAVFSRKSVKDVWYMFRSELQATYLIYEQGYCSLRLDKPGCSYLEMWDLMDPINASGVSLCSLFNSYAAEMRLGYAPKPGGIGRYFKWIFSTDRGTFTLFEILALPQS